MQVWPRIPLEKIKRNFPNEMGTFYTDPVLPFQDNQSPSPPQRRMRAGEIDLTFSYVLLTSSKVYLSIPCLQETNETEIMRLHFMQGKNGFFGLL
jgi:hypothetical protein